MHGSATGACIGALENFTGSKPEDRFPGEKRNDKVSSRPFWWRGWQGVYKIRALFSNTIATTGDAEAFQATMTTATTGGACRFVSVWLF